MAPLDTGPVTHLRLVEPLGQQSGPTPEACSTLGTWLQAVREHKTRTLADMADATRVRITHLQAIEADDFGALPSRPFAIGYVRAYARALGLDGEAAVARFRRESPDQAQALQAPVGVAHEGDARRPVIYAVGGAVVAAVVLWNIAQRIMQVDEVAPASFAPAVAASTAAAPEPRAPFRLAPPSPAPVGQSLPTPYAVPGLAESEAGTSPDAADKLDPSLTGKPAKAAQLVAPAVQPLAYDGRGAIYGVAARASPVLIAARRPGSLVVHAAGGAILFARELAAGEAYRPPFGQGVEVDVSSPDAFDLYVGGRLRGALTGVQTPLDKAAGAPAPTAGPKKG